MLLLHDDMGRDVFVEPDSIQIIRPTSWGCTLYRIGSDQPLSVRESAARVCRMRAYWGTRPIGAANAWAYVYMEGHRVTHKQQESCEK